MILFWSSAYGNFDYKLCFPTMDDLTNKVISQVVKIARGGFFTTAIRVIKNVIILIEESTRILSLIKKELKTRAGKHFYACISCSYNAVRRHIALIELCSYVCRGRKYWVFFHILPAQPSVLGLRSPKRPILVLVTSSGMTEKNDFCLNFRQV